MLGLLYSILALYNKDKNNQFVDFACPDRQTDRQTHTFKQGSLMKHEKVRPIATRFVMTYVYFITNHKPGTNLIQAAFH
jgi:hypothetical protein